MRRIFITLLILIPGADMLPGNSFTPKLKHTGDRNAASYRGDFRFACLQYRGCRYWGTPRFAGTRSFRSLDAGGEMHGGILSIGERGWGLRFYGVLFWLLFICCYYLFYQIEALKIELYKSKLLSNSKSYGGNYS
jgi:hypothetical protein